MAPSRMQNEKELTFFHLVILVLSLLVLSALLMENVVKVPPETARLVDILDTIVCGVFLVDFGVQFWKAESKLKFMKWGWIDLLASIPNLDIMRWGRVARVLRIIRLLRGIRSFQKILMLVMRDKLKSGTGTIALTCLLLISFTSIGILMAERTPDANIKTAEDAVWWSVTTITTVGYGDRYPVTTEGRVIAAVLMVSGVGLFGVLSGLVASYFLGKQQEGAPESEKLAEEVRELRKRIEELTNRQPWS